MGSEVDRETEQGTVVDETVIGEEVEKSILCGDEGGDKENVQEAEVDDENDDDDDPVVDVRNRRRQPQTRHVLSDSEDDNDDEEDFVACRSRQTTVEMPPPLTSTRPPFRKGNSTISNWAQEVVDLTSSPEPPASFVLPPPARARTASFAASSRPTSSASNDAGAHLHL